MKVGDLVYMGTDQYEVDCYGVIVELKKIDYANRNVYFIIDWFDGIRSEEYEHDLKILSKVDE